MIGVVGAGAFGTALAIALARDGHAVQLWARDRAHVEAMAQQRCNTARLPGVELPESVTVTAEVPDLAAAEVVLLSLPMQALNGFLIKQGKVLDGVPLIACCKGVDLTTLQGASVLIGAACPNSVTAVLTGPSFAADIAKGLPTALTLACADLQLEALQHLLSTPTLRLYRSTDVIGAELGGALKNVIAIAAGVVIGAGLGESARAALMTRGYAELLRFALRSGARAETLAGLSGFGDLVLTCTSQQSRNLRFGMALGSGVAFDPEVTVEGAATAKAVVRMADGMGVDMPIAGMVAALIDNRISLDQAIRALMTRPLKQE
ncbi:MAG: NAD(P)H-dependent glycerol-3-phosphate dehydrogenase [Paracoccaceae bacterium]